MYELQRLFSFFLEYWKVWFWLLLIWFFLYLLFIKILKRKYNEILALEKQREIVENSLLDLIEKRNEVIEEYKKEALEQIKNGYLK